MQNKEHWIDRFAKRHERKMLWLQILAAPATFVFLLFSISSSFDRMPHWLWLLGCFSTFFTVLGLAALLQAFEEKD